MARTAKSGAQALSAAGPRMTRQDAEKFLANVPDQYVFFCNDGRILRNLQELKDALSSISEETFSYHANDQKNDFSTWVRDIIKDDKLANDLAKIKTRPQSANIVQERIAFLKSR